MTNYKLHFQPGDFRVNSVICGTAHFAGILDNCSVRELG